MKRMTIEEKKRLSGIIKKSANIICKGKRRIGPQTSVLGWLKIKNGWNKNKNVTKETTLFRLPTMKNRFSMLQARWWKLLKEIWDEIRINNKKMQTTDVDMTSASAEECFDGEMVQSVAEMDISKSPPPFNENSKPCDSFKFDLCHTPSDVISICSSKAELEQFLEPQEFCTSERNTNLSPSDESLASEREKASSTSQCPYCPATNLDPQLAAYIVDLKNYNKYMHRMETLTLEKAELERYSAEANLHHNKLRVDVLQIEKKNAELQNQILTLERKQLEQKIAQQKEMHLLKLKLKNLQMEKAKYQDGNSLYDDSDYSPVIVEPSRQVRNTSDIRAEKTIEYRYVYFQNPTSIGQ